jgi:hypothetical protein
MSNLQDDRASIKAPSTTAAEADPKLEMAAVQDERRAVVEKSLKRKLDLRCSLFVLIYIMSEYSARKVWKMLTDRLP